MLTRRHIRIKVMQSVYSFSLTSQKELKEELLFFEQSVNQFYNLYPTTLFIRRLHGNAKSEAKTDEPPQPGRRTRTPDPDVKEGMA